MFNRPPILTASLPWLLAATLATASAAAAAQPEVPSRRSLSLKTQEPALPGSDATVSIEFPGGTLAQFVDALRQAAGKENANIIVSNQVNDIPLPAISLTAASLRASLMSLESMTTSPQGSSVLGVVAMNGENGLPVYSIRPVTIFQRADRGPVTRVLSLNQLCRPEWSGPSENGDRLPRETVLSAIETAVNLASGEPTASQPQIRFHPDSGLLIIVGSGDQVNAAEMVIENLVKDLERARADLPAKRSTVQVSPVSVPAQRLAEALRDAFPDSGPSSLGLTASDNAVVLTGSADDLRAARAVVRLVDRPAATPPQLIDAMVRLEAMTQEMERLRRALDEREASFAAVRADLEASRAQLREAARARELQPTAQPGTSADPR